MCRKILPVWEQVSATLPQGTALAAVSTAGGEELVSLVQEEAFAIPVRVIRYPERFAKAYKIQSVPLTMVVARGGKVEDAWLGPLDKAKRREIMETVSACVSSRSMLQTRVHLR